MSWHAFVFVQDLPANRLTRLELRPQRPSRLIALVIEPGSSAVYLAGFRVNHDEFWPAGSEVRLADWNPADSTLFPTFVVEPSGRITLDIINDAAFDVLARCCAIWDEE